MTTKTPREVIKAALMEYFYNQNIGGEAHCECSWDMVLSALTAAGYEIERGWQPIETAPKDGTTILLWSEYMSEPCTGAWGTQSHGRLGWNAKHDGMWVVESEHDLSGTTYKEIAVATRWRPLPAPPSEKSDA